MNGKLVYMPAPGQVEIREYPVTPPAPGFILCKVRRTNVCGSELHIFKGHHPTLKAGILGHEMLGEVAALGDGVTKDNAGQPLAVGDRVACCYFRTCMHCRMCLRGHFPLCENAYAHWTLPPEKAPHFHGTFATHYYIYPDQFKYKVPEGVPDYAAASANCALSQVLHGLNKANFQAGESVVIQGAGGLGLYATALVRERGGRAIVIDAVPSRLLRAEQFGAHHVVDMREYGTPEARAARVAELTGGLGADIGLELTGVPDAFAEGVRLVRPAGRYVSIGNISPGQTTTFDPGYMTRRAITIIAMVRYDPWVLHAALQFLAETAHKYPYRGLVDADFALEQAQEALEKSARREVTRASLLP